MSSYPETVWCVVGNDGVPWATRDYEEAVLRAKLWDRQFPSAAPHQTLRYVLHLPSFKESEDAKPDPTLPAEAP